MSWDVVIVGAGPYGLSIAAHLGARGIPFRIFGVAAHTWRTAMPAGMSLKSEGFASSLSDPNGTFTLAHYCTANAIAYADIGLPVELETFTGYCLAFQKRFVPDLDERSVMRIDRDGEGFRVTLDDGEQLVAARVIVAVGIAHYAHLPLEFRSLPETLVSHSSRQADLGVFAGRDIIVLGAGASALDCAALLSDRGAAVHLVARRDKIRFHEPPSAKRRSLLEQLRAPMSGLGPGWRSRWCTDAPLAFHALPERLRLQIVKRHLGPAPGWWTRAKVEATVAFRLGSRIRGAMPRGSRVAVEIEDRNGKVETLEGDHLIAATGYVVDLRKLDFLPPELLKRIPLAEQTPVLSRNFESGVPGLYFVGISAANSFGPMMRFAFGARYTAERLSHHLAKRRRVSGHGRADAAAVASKSMRA